MYEWNWPIFILIDELWKIINLRNGSVPVREGSYIFDIPFFNDFAIYVQGIQQELPNDNKLTVFDVLAMCEVRDAAKQPTDKQIAHRLEKRVIWKSMVRQTLSIIFYLVHIMSCLVCLKQKENVDKWSTR